MSPKFGIVAQAIGVAALAAIVYFAFLSPDDSGPLSGIDVQPPPLDGQPPQQRANKPNENKPRPRRPRRVAASAGSPLAPGPAALTVLPPDSPVGSQYGSTVARIVGRVAQAQP